jgi:uncharacterized repeat protein (TIGR01451 family)
MARLLSYVLSTLIAVSALANADLIVFTDSRNAYLVDPGTTATLIVNMRNKGPDPAENVTLHFPFPPASRLVSLETSDGWTCSANDAGAVCSRATFQPNGLNEAGQHVTATVVLSSDPNGFAWRDEATLTSDTPDQFQSNNMNQITAIAYRMLTVDSTDDSGPGSLRATIADANARCADGVPCKMTFNVPANSTIAPLSPLPAISAGWLRIDGNRTLDGDRLVELSGVDLEHGNGLEIRSAADPHNPLDLEIFGLAINSFPDFGVATTGSGDGNVNLEGLFIGTDVTGTLARPNGRGIGLFNPRNNVNVKQNVISGNVHSGIFDWNSGGLWLSNSLIGVGTDGRALGNGNSGVFEFRGGGMDIYGCTIANSGQFGVSIEPEVRRASIEGTRIFANGITGIDWGLDGPSMGLAARNIPDPPAVTDAVYDPAKNETAINGTIDAASMRLGPLVYVQLFASHSRDNQGRVEGETVLTTVVAFPAGTYSARVKGDLRGQIISATLNVGPYLDSVPTLTSEFSEGVVAH